jgi:O-acetyl-ADP-ribose deacetylase (regulator of RNase III)
MITYLQGDATKPIKPNFVICHVCNNRGAWGAGFVLALSKMWKEPERSYREWFESKSDTFQLGNVQFVSVLPDVWAQNNYRRRKDSPDTVFLDYDALNTALEKVCSFASERELSVHMPRIGCGLAGGKWDLIEPIIKVHSDAKSVEVYVYDFQ